MSAIEVKQGETFQVVCTYEVDDVAAPLTGVTVKSQVRDIAGGLISELTFEALVELGQYMLSGETEGWPVGELRMDVRYTVDGTKTFTDSITLNVVQTQTK